MTITDLLLLHEGEKLRMATDTKGRPFIGVGHDLESKPISLQASRLILADDIADCTRSAMLYPWYPGLNAARQAVVLDMIFNVGPGGFNLFVKFRAAMIAQDYVQASAEILDSQIAPKRAEDLAAMMQTGEWITERG
jgi:lysozyme